MTSLFTKLKPLLVSTAAIYVTIAGIFVLFGILGWTAWDLIGEWLGMIALVALVFIATSAALTFLLARDK